MISNDLQALDRECQAGGERYRVLEGRGVVEGELPYAAIGDIDMKCGSRTITYQDRDAGVDVNAGRKDAATEQEVGNGRFSRVELAQQGNARRT